ncbi:MAG: LLM class flavin-dependent oxidoreductase [Dehalococcoidia bacterium]
METWADEALRVIRALWANAQPKYHSEWHHISGVTFTPETAQKPHPPIWVGGKSKRAMRRAVELGEGWHPNQLTPTQVAEGIEYMRRLCERRGRTDVPVVSMRLRVTFGDGGRGELPGSPEQIAARLREYEAVGVRHVAISFPEVSYAEAREQLERFALEVRPLLS